MGKIITVEHEVAFDKDKPHTCYAEGDTDGWYTNCHYMVYRDRTHGRKAPVERNLPKCVLFDEWLKQPSLYAIKCDACLKACGLNAGEQE